MDRYIVVLRQDERSFDQVSRYIKSLLPSTDISTKSNLEGGQLLKWIPVNQDFSEACPSSELCQWLDVQNFMHHMQDGTLLENNKNVESQTLESYLHDTADSIPSAGCCVQMYIFLHASDLDSEESFLPLAGVMMRLVKWLHVHTSVIKVDSDLSAFGHKLVELTSGELKSITDYPQPVSISWNGEISVRDEVIKDGVVFSGFYIQCTDWSQILKQRYSLSSRENNSKKAPVSKYQLETTKTQYLGQTICGHTMEVLQEVDLRTFPLFLLTPWLFDLHCFDATCNGFELINYLNEKSGTGLVARLRVYKIDGEIPNCGETRHLCTSAWREYVINGSRGTNIDHMPSAFEYLHCLILPSLILTSPASSYSSKINCLRIRVLSTNKELAKNILCAVKKCDGSLNHEKKSRRRSDSTVTKTGSVNQDKDEEKDDNLEWLNSLPVFKVEELFKTLQAISQCNEEAKKDQNKYLKLQTSLLENFLKGKSTSSHTLADVIRSIGEVPEWTSEAVFELSECPEWIALMADMPATDSLKKDISIDGKSPSSPILSRLKPFENTGSKEFSIDRIISLFKESGGNRLKMSLGTIPFNSSSFGSDSSVDKHHHQHDIYHYHTQEDFDSETKYAEIRDQFDFQDTQSSFVTPKKKASKHFNTILPTRSSPRTKLFSRKPSSSRSPPKLLEDKKSTFKHPQALHGSSSSHQHKRPYSSLTPDLAHSQSLKRNSLSNGQSRKRSFSSQTPDADQPKTSYTNASGGPSKILTPDFNLSHSQQSYSSANFSHKRPASSSFTPESEPSQPFKFSRTSTPSPSHLSIPSLKSEFNPACESSPISSQHSLPSSHKRVPFTTVLDMPEVRRSPRKLPGSQSVVAKPVKTLKSHEPSHRSETGEPSNTRQKTESTPKESSTKMKRSERHMMRLKSIIAKVLAEKGVEKGDPIYQACSQNLLNVSIVLLKSLSHSRNLTDEMKSVVYGQVQQIINLEKRRSGISL